MCKIITKILNIPHDLPPGTYTMTTTDPVVRLSRNRHDMVVTMRCLSIIALASAK